jgi:hypothetical protein
LAREENWRSFSANWRSRVLNRFAIPHLHAVELRSRHASLYKHIEVEERRRLLAEACDIVVSHVEAGFVAYMRPAELESLISQSEHSRWGGAYGVCTEVLVAEISRHVGRPERVNIYFEDGHANVGSAMARIAAIKSDTEPVEWPSMVDDEHSEGPSHIEKEMRTSWMRIGAFGTVTKTDSPPSQASDLLAYLTATVMRNDNDPVYAGCLDQLIGRKPHAFRSLSLKTLSELVDTTRLVEQQRAIDRRRFYELRGELHGMGYVSHALPWGLVVDKSPGDQQSELLKQQIADIRKKT